jgi:hypothetical protein
LIIIIITGFIYKPGDINLASSFLVSFRQIFSIITSTLDLFFCSAFTKFILAIIYVIILTNRLKTIIPDNIIPTAEKAGLPTILLEFLFTVFTTRTATALEKVPGITTKIISAVGEAIKTIDSQVFKIIYLTNIIFRGLNIIIILYISNINKKLINNITRKFRSIKTIKKLSIKKKSNII